MTFYKKNWKKKTGWLMMIDDPANAVFYFCHCRAHDNPCSFTSLPYFQILCLPLNFVTVPPRHRYLPNPSKLKLRLTNLFVLSFRCRHSVLCYSLNLCLLFRLIPFQALFVVLRLLKLPHRTSFLRKLL